MKYKINDGFDAMDFARVTEMLGTSFWSPGISKDEVLKGAENSALVVGAFDENNRQVGYSRVISDKTRFAYILDVFVDAECRKHGIGQAMVKHMLDHPDFMDVYQWVVITKDAHGVYQKLGFKLTERTADWMEIRKCRNR